MVPAPHEAAIAQQRAITALTPLALLYLAAV
jgi:hypothetical protein